MKLRMPPRPERYVNPKSVFMLYLMVKNHMAGKYDIVKYNWGMRVSDQAFNKRRDKYFFANLSEKYKLSELTVLFVSNLVANQDAWIGDISDADALSFYREYQGKFLRLNTLFEDDVKNIIYFANKVNVSLKEIFEYNTNTSTSYVFKLLQSGLISFETFLLLDSFLDLINKHDALANDLIWANYSTKLTAYKKLTLINTIEAKKKFIEIVKNNR